MRMPFHLFPTCSRGVDIIHCVSGAVVVLENGDWEPIVSPRVASLKGIESCLSCLRRWGVFWVSIARCEGFEGSVTWVKDWEIL